MGTPNFSVPIMKSLYQNGYPICAVYTQPPKKSMRGQKSNKSSIQKIAENFNLNIRNPNFLSQNGEELKYFKSLSADIVIVVAYGQLIPKEFLNLSKNGFINVHASLLPKWRGAAPIQRAIMNLDEVTGISVMKIAEKNIKKAGMSKYVTMNEFDLKKAKKLPHSEVDLVVVDLGDPWNVVPQARKMLKGSGGFVAICPTMNQLE